MTLGTRQDGTEADSPCFHVFRLPLSLLKVFWEKVGFCLSERSSDASGGSGVNTLQDRTMCFVVCNQCASPIGPKDLAELERKVHAGLSELQSQEWQGLRQTKEDKEISKDMCRHNNNNRRKSEV